MPTGFVGQAWVQISPSFVGFQQLVADQVHQTTQKIDVPAIPIPVTIIDPPPPLIKKLATKVTDTFVESVTSTLGSKTGEAFWNWMKENFKASKAAELFKPITDQLGKAMMEGLYKAASAAIPGLGALVKGLTEHLVPAIISTIKAIQDLAPQLKGLGGGFRILGGALQATAGQFGPLEGVVKKLGDTFFLLAEPMDKVDAFLKRFFGTTLKGATGGIQSFGQAVTEFGKKIPVVGGLISKFGETIQGAGKSSETVGEAFKTGGMGAGVKAMGEEALKATKHLFTLKGAMEVVGGAIATFAVAKIAGAIWDSIGKIPDMIKATFKDVGVIITKGFEIGGKALKLGVQAIGATIGGIGKIISSGFELGVRTLSAAMGYVRQAATAAARGLSEAFTVAAGAGSMLAAQAIKTGQSYNTLYQNANIAFTTILGSAGAADKMMKTVEDFAHTTPFPREVWIESSKQMVGFGIQANKVEGYMQAIGDTAAAAGIGVQGIGDLSYIMAQISAAGKITSTDLMQFGVRGVNAAKLIGDAMGKTEQQIRGDITNGALDANKALDALAKGMEKSYTGAAQRMVSTWEGALSYFHGRLRDIGSAIVEPFISKKGGGYVNEWVVQSAKVLQSLLPTVKKVMDSIMKAVGPTLDKITPFITKIGDSITKATSGVGGFSDAMKGLAPILGVIAPMMLKVGGANLAAVFGPLAPMIEKATSALGPFSGLVIGLVASSPDLRKALMDVTKAFQPLLNILMTLAKDVLGVLTPAITQIGQILAGVITNAVTQLMPLLRVLVGAFAQLLEGILPLVPLLANIASVLINSLVSAVAALLPAFLSLMNVLTPVIQTLIPAIGGVVAALAPVILDVANAFGQLIQAVLPVLPVLANLISSVLGVLPQVIQAIVPAITTLMDALGPAIALIAQGLAGALTQLVPVIPILAQAFAGIIQAVAPIIPLLAQVINSLLAMAAPIIVQVVQILAGLLDQLAPILTNVLAALMPVIQAISNQLGGILTTLAPILGQLLTLLLNLAGSVLQAVLPVIQQLIDALGPAIQTILVALGDAFKTIIPAIQPLATALLGIVKAIIPIIPLIAELVGALLKMAAPIIVQVIQIIARLFQALAPIVQKLLRALMPVIEALGGMLARVIMLLLPYIEQLLGIVMKLFDALAPLLPPLMDLVGVILDLAVKAILPLLDPLLQIVDVLVQLAIQVIKPLLPLISELVVILQPIIQIFSVLLTVVLQLVAGVLEALMPIIAPLMDLVMNLLVAFMPFLQMLAELISILLTAGLPIIKILMQVLVFLIKVALIPLTFFINKVNDSFQVFADVGRHIIDFVKQISDAFVLLGQKIHIGDAIKTITDLWDGFLKIIKDIWHWITGNSPGLIPAFQSLKDIVSGVFDFISGIVKDVWNWIKDHWPILAAVLLGPFGIVIDLVWKFHDQIWQAIQTVWDFVNKIFGYIKQGVTDLGNTFVAVWQNLIKPTWDLFTAAIKWAWDNVISKVFGWIKQGFTDVGNTIKWVWTNLIGPTWDTLKQVFNTTWAFIRDKIFGPMSDAWRHVGDVFGTVKDTILGVFDKLKGGIDGLKSHFTTIIGDIGNIWNGLKNAFKKPVEWVLEFAILPLMKGANFLLGKIGMGIDSEIHNVEALLAGVKALKMAEGGRVPGGWGGGDRIHALLEPGEWVLTKHQAKAMGYDQLRNIPRFAGGGQVPTPHKPPSWLNPINDAKAVGGAAVRGVKGGFDELVNLGEDAVDKATNLIRYAAMQAFDKMVKPIGEEVLDKIPEDTWGFKIVAKLGHKVLDEISKYLHGKSETEAMAQGSALALAVWGEAQKQLGKPYVWGARGPSSFDCSGLWDWSFGTAPGSPSVGWSGPRVGPTTEQQQNLGKPISVTQAGVGDLLFFGSPIHHVAGALTPQTMIHAPHTGDVVRIGSIYEPPSLVKRLIDPAVAGGTPGNIGVPPGDPVNRWRPTVQQAFQMWGMPANDDWVNGILIVIQHESGGNPTAINNWDSNAAAGHPSKGLMQEIDSTFMAYRNPASSTNIYDPLAHIAAGINYIWKRYGGVFNLAGYKSVQRGGGWIGYEEGGRIPGWGGGDSFPALLEPGEWVLTKKQAKALGYGFLAQLPHFALGGYVPTPLQPGESIIFNNTTKPEPVMRPDQWEAIQRGIDMRISQRQQGTGPAVQIDNAQFHDAVDVDLLMSRAEYAIKAGRF
jgi:phage-related protein